MNEWLELKSYNVRSGFQEIGRKIVKAYVTLSIQICDVALLCCSESNSSSPIYVKRDRFVVLRQLV